MSPTPQNRQGQNNVCVQGSNNQLVLGVPSNMVRLMAAAGYVLPTFFIFYGMFFTPDYTAIVSAFLFLVWSGYCWIVIRRLESELEQGEIPPPRDT